MTDNVSPPPDPNEPTPQPAPGPQPGPYVYSPQTGEQPQVPLHGAPQQAAYPGAAPEAPSSGPPSGPPSGPTAYGLPPSGAYPAGTYPGAAPSPAGAYPGAHGAPVDTRDPHTPAPGLPFGSSYRTPRTRWWKGAISAVVVIAAMLIFSLVLSTIAVVVDMMLGLQDTQALTEGRISMTPAILAATNLSLVAGAGVALVAHRWINGVRIGYFHSVAPGLRWRWLLISFAIVAPVYLLFAASSFLDPTYQSLTFSGTTLAFLLIIILTTPLQAAAEEYMFRGVVQRSVGGWFRSHRWGLVVGTAVSATVFSAAHFAGDIWLIVYYLLFGVLLSILTQRTGGLESAIAIHTANNVFLLIVASLAGQMDAGFDRSAGTGGPVMLVPLLILALIVAGLSWFAKRRKLARTTGGADTAAAEAAAAPVPGPTSGAGHVPGPGQASGPGHVSGPGQASGQAYASGPGSVHPADAAPAGSAPAPAATGPIPLLSTGGTTDADAFTEGTTATDPRYAGATTGPIPTDLGRVTPHTGHGPSGPDAGPDETADPGPRPAGTPAHGAPSVGPAASPDGTTPHTTDPRTTSPRSTDPRGTGSPGTSE